MDCVLQIIKNWDEDKLIDLHEKIVDQINEFRRKKAIEYENILLDMVNKIQDGVYSGVYSVCFIDDEPRVTYEDYEEQLRREIG